MGPGRVMALAVTLATLYAGAAAQSGCASAIVSLSPCLSFLMGNASTPSSACCSQLASVVQTEPQCLCTVLNGGASSLGLIVNQTVALTLPGACNVQTPPLSQCNASGGTDAPTGSQESSPSDVSGGSKEVPSTAGSSTSYGIAKMPPPLPLAVLSIFMATFGYVPMAI